MKKIFINYSWQHDSEKAELLYAMLSKYKNYDVWMDKQSIEGGLQWRPAIRKAIRESDFFISLLSAKSIKGRGERNKEIYMALDILQEFPPDEVYLIPALINKCEPPFEQMRDLNWVDLFPDWDEGFKKLLKAVGVKNPVKNIIAKESAAEEKEGAGYHYRVGIVDIDLGLPNIEKITAQLNSIQNYFLFTRPSMPTLKNTTVRLGGINNFAVYKVPETYIEEHRHLAVDLLACITKYPLAFEENNSILYNYFAGPSDHDERFMFLSADHLYIYCKEAGCTLEEGLVSILAGQLIAYFTKLDYHPETRGCVMDFCGNRNDLVFSLKSRSFCKQCLKKIPEGALKAAILNLLKWKYK